MIIQDAVAMVLSVFEEETCSDIDEAEVAAALHRDLTSILDARFPTEEEVRRIVVSRDFVLVEEMDTPFRHLAQVIFDA